MQCNPSPLKPTRDLRLDFWRGLCLLDMLVVHLIAAGASFGSFLDTWLVEYVRFAAGGFVFVAGLSIGVIFLPRAMDPNRRGSAYRALWRRAGLILATHVALEISFLLRSPFPGDSAAHFLSHVLDVLTFQSGLDLLPLYVVLLLLTPAMLAILRRGQAWLLGGLSIAVFIAGSFDPYRMALPMQQTFLPVLWQAVFVCGLLAGAGLQRFDGLPTSVQRRIGFMIALAACVLVGLSALSGQGLTLPFTFSKVPLTFAEFARYVLLTLAILLATGRWAIQSGRALPVRLVCLMGRHSLLCYVVHVWIVGTLARTLGSHIGTPAGAIMAVACGATVLCLFAWLVEQRHRSWDASRWWLRLAQPALAAVVLLTVLPALNSFVWPPPHTEAMAELDAPDEASEVDPTPNEPIGPADVLPDPIDDFTNTALA